MVSNKRDSDRQTAPPTLQAAAPDIHSREGWQIALRSLPYLIALAFAIWALRGATNTDIVDTDAARHALNGALLYDLVRHGQIFHPVAYARYYYAHLPSLSIPYHPPLFPLAESVFFALFGVNVLTARLAIASATFLAFVLMYKLVQSTHSHALALIAVPAFFLLPVSQAVANEVMLEMPALVFVVAAMYVIRKTGPACGLRTALAYALLAAAGVWTKQTVFLGLVPFVWLIIARRLKLLAKPAIWVSSTVLGVFAISLFCLGLIIKSTGINSSWPHRALSETLFSNWRFYLASTEVQMGPVALLLTSTFALLVLFGSAAIRNRLRSEHLYVSWILSAVSVVLLLRPYDERYLFFAYPAFVVLSCSALFRLSHLLLPKLPAPLIPALLTVIWSFFYPYARTGYLHGPGEVATLISQAHASRVLYCGRSDGNFIFALRSANPDMTTTVIRGDKLASDVFTRDHLEEFARCYGIEYVVLERNTQHHPWDPLGADPAPSMKFCKQIRLSSNRTLLNGDLRVYRFIHPTAHPNDRLDMRISVTGQDVEFNLAK